MPLTINWWTDLKGRDENKVNGRVAPETEFEKRLRAYDTARKAYSDSPAALTRASKALDEVEKARLASSTELTRQQFKTLAVHCHPNTRVLASLIAGERTLLASAKPQVDAISKIGQPKLNLNSGPGGNSIRQGKFNEIQDKIKELNDNLRRTPQLTKENIDAFLTHLAGIAKDVELYCKDRSELQSFRSDYDSTVAGLKTVKSKWGDKRAMTTAMQNVGTRLTSLLNARYIK